MLFIRKIYITKKICKYCNIDLKSNTNWYYCNDNVFCSKFCRKNYIIKKKDEIYLGVIYL